MSGNYGYPGANGIHPEPRIATVDEAVTFSPFVSIIPFDTGMWPDLDLSTITVLRPMTDARQRLCRLLWLCMVQHLFDSCQRIKCRPQTPFSVLSIKRPAMPSWPQGAYSALSQICRGCCSRAIVLSCKSVFAQVNERRTDSASKMKTPSTFTTSARTSHDGRSPVPPRDPRRMLSPFARKIFDSSVFPRTSGQIVRDTAGEVRRSSTTVPTASRSEPVYTSIDPKRLVNPSTALNGDQPAQFVNPGDLINPSSQRKSIVINNPVLSAEELNQYVFQPADVQDKSNMNGNASPNFETSAGADQRQKSAAAADRFRSVTTDIFEAEIDFESGNDDAKQTFTVVDTNDGPVHALQPEAQFRLDKATTSLSRFKVMSSVSVEDLSKVQKICSATITAAKDKYLAIGSAWDDSDMEEWAQRLALADQALVAARTILRIMNAGIEEKQLFSEEILSSMLEFFKHIVDSCVISMVELRPSGEANDTFKVTQKNKDKITRLFGSLTRALNILGDVIHSVDLDDTALTAVESMCITLIFVENAPTETTSALGIQTFERVRRSAMDALAKLFDRNVGHRQSIFDDVLTSLERLPVSRQSARQYTLPDAKSIQLVSALLLRLIQTSAIAIESETQAKGSKKAANGNSDEEDAEGEEDDADFESDYSDDEALASKKKKRSQMEGMGLESLVIPAYDRAVGHARYVTNFLVSRALTSTKASGEPYRVLLDIFVDDFINVLGNTDWPAAEMILRQLLTRFWEITENSKNPAPSKAMALELMGSMLTGITDMKLKASEMFEKAQDESTFLVRLKRLYTAMTSDEASESDVLSLQGPYRAIIEYLRTRPDTDSNISIALGYHVTQWAHQILRPGGKDTADPSEQLMAELGPSLEKLLRHPETYDVDGENFTVSTLEGRLGAVMVTMRLPFCRLFNQVFNKLLTTMSSDQASLRSKSLRSVEDVLTKDPSILDRGAFVLNNIARCMTDSSPLVRDAAIGLLATCLNLRQKLDANAYEHVLRRTTDTAISVRRRAIKLSKDLYLRNEPVAIRSKIADALIHCVSDIEPSIVELGRQTLEEIWIAPYYSVVDSDAGEARVQTRIAVQVSLIIETVNRNSGILLVLQDILEDMMSPKSKSASSNIAVCKAFVLLMVDAIIEEDTLPSKPPKAAVMQTLAVFAQARPKLFASAQVQPLLPYLKNLQSGEELDVYRFTIVILRCTLPQILNLPQALLLDTQQSLLANVSKLPASELKEAASCLWALSSMSKSLEKLVTVTRSAMENLKARSAMDLKDSKISRQVERLVLLVGHFISAFDLEANVNAFKDKFPNSKSSQVVGIATEIVCPLTSPKVPSSIRATALEALLCICHAWPKQYIRSDVAKSIELVLANQDPALELVLMRAWRDFFVPGSDRRPVDDKQANGAAPGVGAERIEKTYVATDRDGASTSLAQRFMSKIIHIALTSTGDLSVMSAQVVISINKLGLVHPKESASALVALETSPNTTIAKLAFEEHSALFSKHESIFEKETIRAVQQSFDYQMNTIKDIKGYIGTPPSPKLQLFWDVLKHASAKVRKRFLSNICGHLDFQHGKLDMSEDVPVHVQLTVFCVQNLALFDYTKTEDLHLMVEGLEKIFASTGTAVAHGIEADVAIANNGTEMKEEPLTMPLDPLPEPESLFPANGFDFNFDDDDNVFSFMDGLAQEEPVALPEPANSQPTNHQSTIDPEKLRELTAGAQILMLIWDLRTYLRRVFSLAKSGPAGVRSRPGKDPSKTKDVIRAPQRVPNASAMTEKFLKRSMDVLAALKTEEKQRALCLEFQTLMSVDDEVKVKAETDGPEEAFFELPDETNGGGGGMFDFAFDAAGTTSGDESGQSASGTPHKRGRKRKAAGYGPGGTPKKKRAGSSGTARSRDVDDDEWM